MAQIYDTLTFNSVFVSAIIAVRLQASRSPDADLAMLSFLTNFRKAYLIFEPGTKPRLCLCERELLAELVYALSS